MYRKTRADKYAQVHMRFNCAVVAWNFWRSKKPIKNFELRAQEGYYWSSLPDASHRRYRNCSTDSQHKLKLLQQRLAPHRFLQKDQHGAARRGPRIPGDRIGALSACRGIRQ
jgi:hypothetical protein